MRTFAVLSILAVAACRQRDLTLSVDAVTRDYGVAYETAAVAAEDTLKSLGLKIVRKDVESGMTEIAATDGEGRKSTFHVTRPDAGRSRVLVHVEPGDVEAARDLHEKFAFRIGLGRAREGILGVGGGEWLEMDYPLNLKASYQGALRTCKVLDFLVVRESLEDERGRIEARTADSVPIAIALRANRDGGTHVTFIVGNRKDPAFHSLAIRMKEEFDGGARP